MKTEKTPLPLSSLACPYPDCEVYAQTGQDNLNIRKTYGTSIPIRYLRCTHCGGEFSERKGTAL